MAVPLFSVGDVDVGAVLGAIRASDYVKELASGEDSSPEEAVAALVQPAQQVGSVAEAEAAVRSLQGDWSRRVLVVADAQTQQDQSVLVVEFSPKDSLRVACGSLLEVVARVDASQTHLAEFRRICGSELYDAGQ
ncbi:uncharacterized protein MJAP1_000878 [Malassezia japonica]|uniref:DUF6924 domain-containing protein n=1 Tax=Malassezia japonica TaxID=223818 RepID=A0AAF0EW23_9BASI|nr:uncharacterized protein MJAP1_000878 [Malassezia japonica]WFD37930.1 hypothetical protein MJAP1_000878 [Malassezia japonica]